MTVEVSSTFVQQHIPVEVSSTFVQQHIPVGGS